MSLKKIDFKNPKVQTISLIVLLGIGGIFLWYQQIWVPTVQTIEDLKGKQKAKQDELNTILSLKPRLNVLQAELNASQVKLDSLKSIFPDQKEIPKLIREITAVTRASGIYTTKFNPLPDIERDYYIENRYSMAVMGGYHGLAEFFSFLANFPLIINLSSVIVTVNPSIEESRKQNEEQGTALQTVAATFEMTTFSSKR